MKLFISALVFAAATTAHAFPAVNDAASFSGTYTTQGNVYPIEMTLSVLSFDANTQTFTVRQVLSSSGSVLQDQQSQQAANQMVSEALVNEILAKCAQYNGVIEQVTVPAGTFNTCKVPYDDAQSSGVNWIGLVPFGIVKAQDKAKDGSYESALELAKFQAAQ